MTDSKQQIAEKGAVSNQATTDRFDGCELATAVRRPTESAYLRAEFAICYLSSARSDSDCQASSGIPVRLAFSKTLPLIRSR